MTTITKTSVKTMENNALIMELINTYTMLIIDNGKRNVGKIKSLNVVANELKERGLLSDADIKLLNE